MEVEAGSEVKQTAQVLQQGRARRPGGSQRAKLIINAASESVPAPRPTRLYGLSAPAVLVAPPWCAWGTITEVPLTAPFMVSAPVYMTVVYGTFTFGLLFQPTTTVRKPAETGQDGATSRGLGSTGW